MGRKREAEIIRELETLVHDSKLPLIGYYVKGWKNIQLIEQLGFLQTEIQALMQFVDDIEEQPEQGVEQ